MFKKSLLGIALSFAIFNAHANEIPQQVDTEIVKYEGIISKLKLQLIEKEDFNKKLQAKLDEAMSLSKTIQPENVTQKQAVALNDLILKLNKNIQENKGDNQTLKNKIEVLDQFLNNYKKKIVDSNNNIITQNEKHELTPNSEVKEQELKADDLKKKEEIEKALANKNELDLKPVADVKPQELSAEDKAKQQKIEESIKFEKENKVTELKPEAPITKKELTPEESLAIKQKEEKSNPESIKKETPQLVESKKIEESVNKPIQNIEVEEEKGFINIIKDKINALIEWFRNLFEPSNNENETNVQQSIKPVVKDIPKVEAPVAVVTPEPPKVVNETVESIQEVNNEIDRSDKEVPQKPTISQPVENNEVYKSFESEAVEHIAHGEQVKNEPVKSVKNENFDKELEDFINKEQSTENSNSENKKDQEALGKSIDQSIIIKVDKNKSDIKGTAFESEKHDISKPLQEDYVYKVKLGDNLTKIVKKHFSLKNNQDINKKVQEIVDLNKLKNKNLVHVGDSIRLR